MSPNALDMDVAQADYDALADLFLADEPLGRPKPPVPAPALKLAHENGEARTEARATTSDQRSPSAACVIEAVLAGHLPVLASAWITQYARHVADTHAEPVALLRLVAGQAILDLILPTGHKIPADLSAAPNEPLPAVLARITPRFRRWVIRVDEPCEPDLLAAAGLTRIAILTGADDPAVIASFQAIKRLAHDLPDPAPDLALVIMGSPDDRADAAETKLRRAASQFLSRDLPPATRIPKIGSSLNVQLYRAHTTTSITDVVSALKLPLPEGGGRGVGSSDSRPQPTEVSKQTIEPPVLPAPGAQSATEPARASAPVSSAPPPLHSSTSRLGPLPTSTNDPLFAQLHLTPLPITCPYAPAIRTAHDQQGRLHLLALTEITPAEAASRLLTAASWASDHAALLTAAAPALRSAADPTLHVLTTDAKLVRSLLDTGLRLHVVTHIELHGQTYPAVAPLN